MIRDDSEPFTRKRPKRRASLNDAVREFERRYIVRALREHGGSITHAATALGISRQSLQRKVRRLGIARRSPRR